MDHNHLICCIFVMPPQVLPTQFLVGSLVVLLLFGGKKIPELMRGLGKGVKSFKQGMKEVEDDVKEIKKDLESEDK